jgi:hypothetical protein
LRHNINQFSIILFNALKPSSISFCAPLIIAINSCGVRLSDVSGAFGLVAFTSYFFFCMTSISSYHSVQIKRT